MKLSLRRTLVLKQTMQQCLNHDFILIYLMKLIANDTSFFIRLISKISLKSWFRQMPNKIPNVQDAAKYHIYPLIDFEYSAERYKQMQEKIKQQQQKKETQTTGTK